MRASTLQETHLKNEGHARPRFKAVILHVDEKTSIKRQLERGNAALEASQRASETGVVRGGITQPLGFVPVFLQPEVMLSTFPTEQTNAHAEELVILASCFESWLRRVHHNCTRPTVSHQRCIQL